MIAFNRSLRFLINIKSIRSNFDQKYYRHLRYISTIKGLQSNDFRKKTEKFPFNNVKNADADIFGTLTDNVEINKKLDSLPPEVDDIIQYDTDEQHKRLHITEYHKIIKDLIKQHKALNKIFIIIINFLFLLFSDYMILILDCRCNRST